jgi:hypothetical protein
VRSVLALTRLDAGARLLPSLQQALEAADPVYLGREDAVPPPAEPEAAAEWAAPSPRLALSPGLAGPVAARVTVAGRRLLPPLLGFGQVWRKTYSIRLAGAAISPAAVVADWKRDFGRFWPAGNRFLGVAGPIAPGAVAVLDLKLPGPLRLCTGVQVIHCGASSFTFQTAEGHMYGGLITFSAHEDRGTTVVQVQPLTSGSDPAFEAGIRIGLGQRIEDRFWQRTLEKLAGAYGVAATAVTESALVHESMQWSRTLNARHNALVWTLVSAVVGPLLRR